MFPLPFPRAAAGPHSPHRGPRGSQLAGGCSRSESAAHAWAEGMLRSSPAASGHFTNLYGINKWGSLAPLDVLFISVFSAEDGRAQNSLIVLGALLLSSSRRSSFSAAGQEVLLASPSNSRDRYTLVKCKRLAKRCVHLLNSVGNYLKDHCVNGFPMFGALSLISSPLIVFV